MKTESTIFPNDAGLGNNLPGVICAANESRFVQANLDIPLTAFAVGYRDPANLAGLLEFVAPAVPTTRRFTYREHSNPEQFLSEDNDIRAIGADFKRVEYTGTEVHDRTDNKGLIIPIDLDEVDDLNNWQQQAVARLIDRLLRNEVRRAVTLLSAAAVNTAKTWDATAGKDPDMDILNELVNAADTSGLRPNRGLYGETAWTKRVLSHRAQNIAGGYASAGLSEGELGGFLGIDVNVARARYQNTPSTKAQIVNNLVLLYNAFAGQSTEDPSNIKRFVTSAGGSTFRVFVQQVSAKIYEVAVEHYSKIKITSTLGIRKETIS